MKLYILGKNKEEKGSALEELSGAILSHLGYTVIRNYIGYGGHEIDVVAKCEYKVIGETKEVPVICECKAHDKPILMGDWLKFLGKVLVERMNCSQTMGVMIALSGANGNVISNYESLPDKSFLSLISNDRLTDAVCQHYKLKSVEEVRSFVEHKTTRPIDSIDIVYYEKEMWWLISFSHGEFTVFSNNFVTVKDVYLNSFLDDLQELSPYVKTGYRDLLKEEISKFRNDILVRSAAFHLMKNGQTPYDDLLEIVKGITHQLDIDKYELKKAVEEYPYFVLSEEGEACMKKMEVEEIANFYRWYLSGNFILNSIISDFYRDNINEELLDYIISLQNSIELSKEQREDSLFILRLSPSALQYALHKDKIITNFRDKKTAKNKIFNKFHTDQFLDSLSDCFVKDIEHGRYSLLYNKEYDLTEYSVEKVLTLKFKGSAHNKTINYKKRVGLYEYDGEVLPAILFNKNDS